MLRIAAQSIKESNSDAAKVMKSFWVYGLGVKVYMVYDVWCVVCGVWCMVYVVNDVW